MEPSYISEERACRASSRTEVSKGTPHTCFLDPRTKLFMLLIMTTLMFSTGTQGIMGIIKPVLSLLPFCLLFTRKQWKTAVKYALLYLLCFLLERFCLPHLTGFPSFLLMAVTSIMTRFAPGIMMAAYLVSSTTVSEFVAAMERMHVPDTIVIPLSVIFRFLPTIQEEYQAISDAMRMRGIRFGGRHPFLILEYRLVPLMISIVKIGDELSAAALSRGLGAPIQRTNICRIGFHIQDFAAFVLCMACFMGWMCQNILPF